ncbi:MAG TPA: glycosyltransferase family 39 protein [Candidatus Dormibacteraeota bacterium]|nr:glycosyltransferase family 39 protein [Candidatus Dormibacteraeota bacterium]
MRARIPWQWIALFAAVKLALTMSVAGRYGWHQDELYYLASSRHLELGYVDYPAVVPLLAAADQAIAPGSLVALRLLPAIAGSLIIVLTALIARELGATSRGQAWAALAAFLSPMFIGGTLMFQTVAFDELMWAIALLVLARILREGGRGTWLVLGLVLGVGLETKFTIIALVVAILLSLLIARRSVLATPWPWLGAAIALVLLAPNLEWQATHDWVSVQYTLSHRGHTDGPVAYWLQQLLLINPLFLIPGIAGMAVLRRDARFAPLVYTTVLVELIFFASGGKAYYPAPIYPLVYAAGAMWVDQHAHRRWPVISYAAASVALILVLLPVGLPVLDVHAMIAQNLWQTRPDYAQMIGWPEVAQETAQAYDALPPDQRSGAVILAHYYGEAGAIDYYGPALGLPSAVSPHLTYWYWAPARLDPRTAVLVNFTLDEGNRLFADCRQVGSITNRYGIHNDEYGAPILVCSNPRKPLWQEWASLQTLD